MIGGHGLGRREKTHTNALDINSAIRDVGTSFYKVRSFLDM